MWKSKASLPDSSTTAPDSPLAPAAPAEHVAAPAVETVDEDSYGSMEQYFLTERALWGRWAQLEEFRKRAVGVHVRWQGHVVHITTFADGAVAMYLRDTAEHEVMGASLPPEFREQAFALRTEQLVQITGTLAGTPASVSISGDSLQVVADEPAAV